MPGPSVVLVLDRGTQRPRPAPLDSRLRGNDECGAWIPACVGMTNVGRGFPPARE